MKITNTNKVWVYDLTDKIRKDPYLTTLSEYQIGKIREILKEYDIIEWKKTEPTNFFSRLTTPFFFLTWGLLFFIICPIKFLFTGKFYLDYRGRTITFLRKWSEKVGFGNI
jgi:hypothetical protein